MARFRDQGPEIGLEIHGDLADLPAAVEVVTFRVVTEALTNVVRHAGARHASVTVRRGDRHLDVRVDDDGRGVAEPAREGGVGLTSIRDRAEELGGRSEFRSDRSGTSVGVLLPLDA